MLRQSQPPTRDEALPLPESEGFGRTSPLVPVRNTYVVKLRDLETRSWRNETEVVAASAREAAEQAAGGEHLTEGPGERSKLRARVWRTPYGTTPDLSFYAKAGAPSL